MVFIGGVTFAEIAAVRFLQTRPEYNADFIVATTKLLNGNSLGQSFQDAAVMTA